MNTTPTHKLVNIPLKVTDWTLEQGVHDKDEVPEWASKEHDLEVRMTSRTQMEVFLGNKKTGEGLVLLVDVNMGIPSIHIAGDMFGDNLFHIHRTKKGVVIESDSDSPTLPGTEAKTADNGEIIPNEIIAFYDCR